MVVNDNLRYALAKALNGESYDIPSHLGVGEGTIIASPTLSALSEEVGDRIATSKSRSNEVVTFNAVRSGAEVAATDTGDTLKCSGLFTAITGGDLMVNNELPSVLHTIDFDLDFDYAFTISRR